MKKKWKAIIAFIVVLVIIIPSVIYLKSNRSKQSDNKEVVLFNGKASASGSWDPWGTLTEITDFKGYNFMKPFTVKVNYEGESAPYIIFTSSSGGNTWGQIIPSYFSEGTAYYTYESCTAGYGKDFSNLDKIIVKPGGSDVTITKVSIVPEDDTEINVNYKGPAGNIVNSIDTGWNLGNSLDVTDGDETAWENPATTKAMIDAVKVAGFNAVRIPITWSEHVGDEASGFKIDEKWMNRVKQVVDYCREDQLYTIINMHHDVGKGGWLFASDNSVKENGDKFKAIWSQIADEFKDYDDKLLFEGFNEMLDENIDWNYPGKEATKAVNTFNQMFVDTVRKTGGNNKDRCLIVGTYANNTNGNVLDDFIMPKDTVENSLIVQIHFYIPYEYTQVISENTKQAAWKENDGKVKVDGALINLYNHFTSKGVPVIITEMAAANKNNLDDRVDYSKYMIKESRRYGIKCFWWDQGGKFEPNPEYGYYTGMGLLDRYTLKWMYPEIVEALTSGN